MMATDRVIRWTTAGTVIGFPLCIPGGRYEIPLVIQDRQFNPDGTFRYPVSGIPGVVWIGEYFGDVMLVTRTRIIDDALHQAGLADASFPLDGQRRRPPPC